MRIKKLELENYKSFKGKHEIDISDNSICAIVGVNGSGKTSLLDAIIISLQILVSQLYRLPNSNRVLFSEKDISLSKTEGEIRCTIENNDYITGILTTKKHLGGKTNYSIKEADNLIISLKKNFEQVDRNNLPVLIYYQTDRNFRLEDDKSSMYSLNSVARTNSYKNAFNPIINYTQILNWYIQQINIENSEKVKRRDLNYTLPSIRSISIALNNFLENIDAKLKNILPGISRFTNEQTLLIDKEEYQIEFSQLSAGEKMIIGIVLDIAFRMSTANPKMENPILSEGIILIDEIELHLHPKWQMSIIEALHKTFPNIQFIISTHSPLIINQLRSKQIIIASNSKIINGKNLHNTYGRDVNSIIEDFMGATKRPLSIKKLFREIDQILNNNTPDFEEAKNVLNKIKNLIDPNDDDVLKLEMIIAIEEDEVH